MAANARRRIVTAIAIVLTALAMTLVALPTSVAFADEEAGPQATLEAAEVTDVAEVAAAPVEDPQPAETPAPATVETVSDAARPSAEYPTEGEAAPEEVAPSEEAPADEAPVEETPADEAPAEEETSDEATLDEDAEEEPAEEDLLDVDAGQNVWVNGSTGSDSNNGTEASPVKTFELAKELLNGNGGDTIFVTGAITLNGTSATWSLGGKTLARGNNYHGTLVSLTNGASLTLTDIVLDGRSGDGQTGRATGGLGDGGSLVSLYKQSTLTVGLGAVLQNNTIESLGKWYPESGGGIFASESTVNVEGGTIRNNSAVWGGGIHGTNRSTINVSSGTISGNEAVDGKIRSSDVPRDYGGCGGGICAADGTGVNFSGGTISGNHAFNRGGGISMGTCYAARYGHPVLVMTGGTITDNSAGSSGGGIFVQAGYSSSYFGGTGSYSIAYITAGSITNNAMTGTGNANNMFGGGGIYVNGYSSRYTDFHNGELYLTNVVVAENSANYAGGGYAACPVSKTDVELTNGAVFYNNTTTNGNARELYILASNWLGTHSGNPTYDISPSMLGGGAYRWTYNDGTEVPYDKLQGILIALYGQSLSLSNSLDGTDEGVQRGISLARVFITGNTSVTRGGGIGSNGSVFIGSSVDPTEVTVTKTWSDANDADGLRPETVYVELYRDGVYVGYQTMTADANGNWSTTFRNLPKQDAEGHEYVYTVRERTVEGYTATVTGNANDGYKIVNTRTIDLDGSKTWVDDDNAAGTRPTSITVRLYADGVEVRQVTVTEEDGWTFSFEGLAKYDEADGHEIEYSISEDEVEGYTTQIDGFEIVNTIVPTPPTPETPEEPTTPKRTSKSATPKTGESGPTEAQLLVVALLGIALAGFAVGDRFRRGAAN